MPLKKTIGRTTLLLLTLNAILGTGIFFLPAIGAQYAGPASLISWIIMSIIAVLISMYFAELVSMFPKSGGVFEYVKKSHGEFASFIAGWTAWIVANVTIAMLIVGSLYYLFSGYSFLFSMFAAIIFIIVFNYVSYRGIGVSTKLLVFFGVMTIISLLALILPGVAQISPANFDPFFVAPIPFIFLAIYFIAETFFGWETATYLSEEVKNARKVVPKVLIHSTIIIALISIALVFVCIGVAGSQAFGMQEVPLVFISNILFGSGFTKIFAIIVFIPLIGTAASWIVSSPRLLYAMSRDKVLVSSLGKINKKHQTPHNAILFQTIVSICVTIVGLANFRILLSLLIPLVIILYSFVMLSFLKLRATMPKAKRYYKAPLGRAGPVFIILFNIALLIIWLTQVSDALSTLLLGIFFILIGIPLYIIIKLQTDEKFTGKFYDSISTFWDKSFSYWYGKAERKKVIEKLKLKSSNIVLDFGCGSGLTTYEISKRVSNGTVIAVDLSEKQMKKAMKKTGQTKMPNVIYIKESKLRLRNNCFDAVAAVGVLEHMENPKEAIRKLIKLLKKGGHFSFMSFGRSLGIPGPDFLKNEKAVRDVFKGLNVTLNVKKESKKLTEYWYVWGEKN